MPYLLPEREPLENASDVPETAKKLRFLRSFEEQVVPVVREMTQCAFSSSSPKTIAWYTAVYNFHMSFLYARSTLCGLQSYLWREEVQSTILEFASQLKHSQKGCDMLYVRTLYRRLCVLVQYIKNCFERLERNLKQHGIYLLPMVADPLWSHFCAAVSSQQQAEFPVADATDALMTEAQQWQLWLFVSQPEGRGQLAPDSIRQKLSAAREQVEIPASWYGTPQCGGEDQLCLPLPTDTSMVKLRIGSGAVVKVPSDPMFDHPLARFSLEA